MASFYKEKTGLWTCAYQKPGEKGEMKRAVKRGFPREKDAVAWFNGIASDLQSGAFTDPGKLTVAQWLRSFLSAYCGHLQPSTKRGYENSIEKHLIPRIGAYRLRDLQPVMVQSCYNDIAKSARKLGGDKTKVYAPSFVHQVHICLHRALEMAVRDGLLNKNPTRYAELPSAPPPSREYCTPDQVRAVLAGIAGGEAAMPVMLCASLGLRRGEALGLRWQDVDMDACTAVIQQQVVISDRELVCKSLKNTSSYRTVPVPAALVDALKAHKKAQAAVRLSSGKMYKDQGFICADETGTPLRPDSVSRAAKTVISRVAPGLSLHDLRHTYATLLRQSDVPIEVISGLLGHASVSTTFQFYVGDDSQAKKLAADKINNVIDLGKSATK